MLILFPLSLLSLFPFPSTYVISFGSWDYCPSSKQSFVALNDSWIPWRSGWKLRILLAEKYTYTHNCADSSSGFPGPWEPAEDTRFEQRGGSNAAGRTFHLVRSLRRGRPVLRAGSPKDTLPSRLSVLLLCQLEPHCGVCRFAVRIH